MQDLVNNAPKLVDFLGDESLEHYKFWKNTLVHLGIQFYENPRLVRGLDYYNLSVFEWVSSNLGAQGTIAAGGRYDPLVQELSGKDNYAIGFAIGLERLLLELQALNKAPAKSAPDIFIANSGNGTSQVAFEVAVILRGLGYNVIQNFGSGSFKSQLKRSNSLNCKITLIIGETEVLNRQVMVKSMDKQIQEAVSLENLNDYFKQK